MIWGRAGWTLQPNGVFLTRNGVSVDPKGLRMGDLFLALFKAGTESEEVSLLPDLVSTAHAGAAADALDWTGAALGGVARHAGKLVFGDFLAPVSGLAAGAVGGGRTDQVASPKIHL